MGMCRLLIAQDQGVRINDPGIELENARAGVGRGNGRGVCADRILTQDQLIHHRVHGSESEIIGARNDTAAGTSLAHVARCPVTHARRTTAGPSKNRHRVKIRERGIESHRGCRAFRAAYPDAGHIDGVGQTEIQKVLAAGRTGSVVANLKGCGSADERSRCEHRFDHVRSPQQDCARLKRGGAGSLVGGNPRGSNVDAFHRDLEVAQACKIQSGPCAGHSPLFCRQVRIGVVDDDCAARTSDGCVRRAGGRVGNQCAHVQVAVDGQSHSVGDQRRVKAVGISVEHPAVGGVDIHRVVDVCDIGNCSRHRAEIKKFHIVGGSRGHSTKPVAAVGPVVHSIRRRWPVPDDCGTVNCRHRKDKNQGEDLFVFVMHN